MREQIRQLSGAVVKQVAEVLTDPALRAPVRAAQMAAPDPRNRGTARFDGFGSTSSKQRIPCLLTVTAERRDRSTFH